MAYPITSAPQDSTATSKCSSQRAVVRGFLALVGLLCVCRNARAHTQYIYIYDIFSSAVLRMVDFFLQNPWDAYVHVFSYIIIYYISPSHLHQYPIIIHYPINPIISVIDFMPGTGTPWLVQEEQRGFHCSPRLHQLLRSHWLWDTIQGLPRHLVISGYTAWEPKNASNIYPSIYLSI